MKWPYYKNIQKLYKFNGDWIQFTYYNKSYSRNTVQLMLLLWEEIYKDFPQVSEEDIFVTESLDFPKELLLQFRVRKEMVTVDQLSKFDMLQKKTYRL